MEEKKQSAAEKSSPSSIPAGKMPSRKKSAPSPVRPSGTGTEDRTVQSEGREPARRPSPRKRKKRRPDLRARIFEVIQIGQTEDLPSRLFDYLLVFIIFANITVLILGTFEELNAYAGIFQAVEMVTVLFFCLEYGLRIWTADLLYPGLSRGEAILRFVLSYDGIVDLFTILPFFFLLGFSAFRILRVVRIFHLFRINSTYDSFNVITEVIYEKKNQIVSSVVIILILMLASSLCIYSVEHDAQPEAFKNAFSGIWWSMTTIFTVGYGDIVPITLVGRILAVITTFLGVGVVAIPTGIISAGFVEQYQKVQQESRGEVYRNSTSCLYVDESSGYAGRNIRAVEEEHNYVVTAVVRGSNVLVPKDDLVLEGGDTIIYMTI